MIKKRYLATFLIPLCLAAIIAALLTPTPEKAFFAKLDSFQKKNDVYSRIVYSVDGENSYNLEQYKVDGEYYAKYYPSQGIPIIVNTKGAQIKFGNDFIASSTTIEHSKDDKSLFWLDKISSKDIIKGSVQRDKTAEEGYVYDAKLNDDSQVRVTFYNSELKRIEYKNVGYSSQIVNVVPMLPKGEGVDIVVEIIESMPESKLSEEFVISDSAKVITLRELKENLSEEDYDEEDSSDAFAQFKRAIKGIQEVFEEEENVEEDVYEEDEGETSGTINPHEFGASDFHNDEHFRIIEQDNF